MKWAEVWIGGKRTGGTHRVPMMLRVEVAVPRNVDMPAGFRFMGVLGDGRRLFVSRWEEDPTAVREEVLVLVQHFMRRGVKVSVFNSIRRIR
ncbi:MAG: hypothetical protein ACTSXJ_10735 [Candidatus Baldrarchaeia archaeon]